MNAVSECLLSFFWAYRLATHLNNPDLLANTLYYIGNVYNAWNGEPHKTIDYYSRSTAVSATLPHQRVKEYYLRYIMAHAYNGEKAADSIRCIQAVQAAFRDMKSIPLATLDSMIFCRTLPGWVPIQKTMRWPTAF